jgi:DNA-binding response OmpR family regulator
MMKTSGSLFKPSASGFKIALLEDDPLAIEIIQQTLAKQHWKCQHFFTVADICVALKQQSFDLLILDWSLSDGEADQVIRLVRNDLALKTPILIQSVNNDEQQVVNALLLGADDYVFKPLRIYELQARITVLLRNRQHLTSQADSMGGYRFDKRNRQIYLNNDPLELTTLEYDLAHHFFSHLNELLSREHLLKEVWEQHPDIDTRTVDVFVSRLRKKLKLEPDNAVQLRTLRGYGYRMENVS